MPANRRCWPRCPSAKPKIADYPFTTLKPQLGVVRSHDEEFVLADLPGLIEGASEGAGLGHRFLGHVERCAVILHLVDAHQDDVVGAWKTIRGELKAYGDGLTKKPEIVGLNKSDAVDPKEMAKKRAALKRAGAGTVMVMSGVIGRRRGRGHGRAVARSSARRARRRRCRPAPRWTRHEPDRRLMPAASSSRSARPCWSTKRPATSGAPGSKPWSRTSSRCRERGQEVLIVSSGAIAVGRRHLGLAGRPAAARGKAGRGRGRADPPGACLSGGAGAPRHHRGADPADARRHRGAPPPSERARDDRAAAGARRACRSSTRTTRWPPPRSASATTTGWPRASRR